MSDWCAGAAGALPLLLLLLLLLLSHFLLPQAPGASHPPPPYPPAPPDVQRCQRQCRDSYFADLPGTTDLCSVGCAYFAEGGLGFCKCTCIALARTKVQLSACFRGCGFGELFLFDTPLVPDGGAAATVGATTGAPLANDSSGDAMDSTLPSTDASAQEPPPSGPPDASCVDRNGEVASFMARLIGQELNCAVLSELGSCAADAGLAEVRRLCAASCAACGEDATVEPQLPSAGSSPGMPAVTTVRPGGPSEHGEDGGKDGGEDGGGTGPGRNAADSPSRIGILWGMGAVLLLLLVLVAILITLRRRHQQRGSWAPGAKMRVRDSAAGAGGLDSYLAGPHSFVLGPVGAPAARGPTCDAGEPPTMFTRTMVLPPATHAALARGAPPEDLRPRSEGTVRHGQERLRDRPAAARSGDDGHAAAAAADADGLPPRSPARAWQRDKHNSLHDLGAESSL